MKSRIVLFTLLLALSALVRPVAAQPAPAAAAQPNDPWLDTISALLVDRYQLAGELQLAWTRGRPVNAPAHADLIIVQAPAEIAPQILVTVRATDDAGRATEHTLVLRAELWRDGWILREPVGTSTPLDALAMDTRRFDALREREAIVADSTAELNFSRNVPAGRLITWRDVVRRPLIRRGQAVEVLASSGALTITMRGVALQDAARGEAVRVRNPDSKKDIIALAVSESRASVRF